MIILQAPRDTLLRPLQVVCGIVERRTAPLPILSSVQLAASARRLSFRSTDLELELNASTLLDTDAAEVALTVNARRLIDVVRAMPDTLITLAASATRLTVEAADSRISLAAGEADALPSLRAQGAPESSFAAPAGAFKRLLHSVHFAMADNDIRYFLNGALLICGPQLTAAANDGHRLATAGLSVRYEGAPRQVIVPRKAVTELIRLLPDDDSTVEAQLFAGHVLFRFGQVQFTAKLIEGRYPDFRRAIPSTFDAAFTLDRQRFLASLQRAAVLDNGKFPVVHCRAEQQRLHVRAQSADHEESVETLAIAYDGDAVELSFNVRYLLDVMTNLRADTLDFQMSETHLSALITTPAREDFKYVVMALRK